MASPPGGAFGGSSSSDAGAWDGSRRATKRRPTLLIVDDEPNVRSSLRRIFRKHDLRILTAANGKEALEILEEGTVSVIISDMRMPEMDGAQLLQEVTRRWPEIQRILLTGYADLQITTQAIRSGWTDHFLTKPWDREQIERCVRDVSA